MPLVVIPDFTVTPKPAVADVRNAEKALIEVIGGVHEATRYPGDLDGSNIAAAAGFSLRQHAERRGRVTSSAGRFSDVNPAADIPNDAGPKALILVGQDIDCDVLTFWHSDPSTLTGKIAVYRNGFALTELQLPAAGIATGAPAEFEFPYALVTGDVIDVRWLDGVNLLKTVAGAAPAAYTRAFVTIWGVAQHVA